MHTQEQEEGREGGREAGNDRENLSKGSQLRWQWWV